MLPFRRSRWVSLWRQLYQKRSDDIVVSNAVVIESTNRVELW